eukprot:1194800-Amphidinium_carterae.1
MTKQLDMAAGRDSAGRGLGPWEEAQAKRAPALAVYALHSMAAASDGGEEAPLALAFTSQRNFPVGGVPTMHLDNFVSNPAGSLPGTGEALLGALVVCADASRKVMTVEPQSDELEAYFSRLGFRGAPSIDQYL